MAMESGSSAAHASAVEFVSVEKRFGEVPVLNGLDLRVTAGEKVAIIGRSGSGKTTILRLLMGLERPTAGKVLVNGRLVWDEPGTPDMKRVRAAGQRMGFVFQHFNLFPHMTAIENVASGPMYAQRVDRRTALAKARRLLGQVGLEDKEQVYPAQLSGGQQQRVAIARALAKDPEILLFDEPTSALDPELVGEVLSVIAAVAKDSDVTMLLVTHEMSFARRVADRVVFCDEGRIVEEGDPTRVLTNPEHERTRAFLNTVLHPIPGTP
jgi:polar amino acid transport system ATP-binding protein